MKGPILAPWLLPPKLKGLILAPGGRYSPLGADIGPLAFTAKDEGVDIGPFWLSPPKMKGPILAPGGRHWPLGADIGPFGFYRQG
eukprot:5223490-Karenia_brevis.AAC.1